MLAPGCCVFGRTRTCRHLFIFIYVRCLLFRPLTGTPSFCSTLNLALAQLQGLLGHCSSSTSTSTGKSADGSAAAAPTAGMRCVQQPMLHVSSTSCDCSMLHTCPFLSTCFTAGISRHVHPEWESCVCNFVGYGYLIKFVMPRSRGHWAPHAQSYQ